MIPPPTPSLSPHLSAARGERHFSLSNKNCPQKSEEGGKRKEEFTFANKTFSLSLFSVQVGQLCTKLPAGVWILRRPRIVAQHGESGAVLVGRAREANKKTRFPPSLSKLVRGRGGRTLIVPPQSFFPPP